MRLPTTIAILALASCAADRARFHPANPTGTGHAGQPAAAYDLRTSPERPADIAVKVWSRGAYEESDRTLVHLAMELQNTADRSVALDLRGLGLQTYDRRGRPLPDASLVQVGRPGGSVNTVNTGEAATFWMAFAVPRIDPDDIATMRLRWEVASPGGASYVQFTEFSRLPEHDDLYGYAGWSSYDPMFGRYNPYFYGAPYFYGDHVPVRRVIVVDRRPSPRP